MIMMSLESYILGSKRLRSVGGGVVRVSLVRNDATVFTVHLHLYVINLLPLQCVVFTVFLRFVVSSHFNGSVEALINHAQDLWGLTVLSPAGAIASTTSVAVLCFAREGPLSIAQLRMPVS